MLVWIDAAQCGRIPKIFDLTLVERHLQALKHALPRPARIVVDLGPDGVKPKIAPRLNEAFSIEWRQGQGDFAARLKAFLAEAGNSAILLLDGATLPDERLHKALVPLDQSVVVMAPKAQERAAMIRLAANRTNAEHVDAADFFGLAEQLLATDAARAYRPEESDGFIRKLRRTVPFYLFRVEDSSKAAKVEKFLFWSNYKGSTDFFTRYVYPPLVWICVERLARARVHPNAVTIVSIILALGAVPAWATGHFWIGFAMAVGMTVLDSVDGKLARLTFTQSPIGNVLDHGLDLVHPPLWYLAWASGIGLAALGWNSALGIAVILLVAFYIVDRIILQIYQLYFQRGFHTHCKFDGRVRTFIARRNITLAMFLIGYALNLATEAFYLIAAWQILTGAYHGSRIFWIIIIDRTHLKDHRPSDVARPLKYVD